MKTHPFKRKTFGICVAAFAAAVLSVILFSGCQTERTSMASLKVLFETKEEIVIDCLGDSITWGMFNTPTLKEAIASGEIKTSLDDGGQLFEDYGIYVSGVYQSDPSYPEVLEADLNEKLEEGGYPSSVKTVNDGICGDWLTKDTWRRMSCEPEIVVFLMGSNNYYFNYPAEGLLESNVEALLKEGKIVYLANYPFWPKGPHEEAFLKANAELSRIAEKYQLTLIDFSGALENMVQAGEVKREDLYSTDFMHLSEKGYQLLGKIAADEIYKDLKK